MKKMVMLAGLLLAGTLGLFAQVFDFTVINKTGYIIDEVYVSPADDNDWGDDVLGVDRLADGKSFEIKFDKIYEAVLLAFGVDKYDLKIVDQDGDEFEYYDLKLEDITQLTLTLDKNGNGVASWK